MRAVLARNLEGRGINLHPGTNLSELIKTERGIKVVIDHKSWWQMQCPLPLVITIPFSCRIPNTKWLNLGAGGIELDQTGAIKVDDYSRTNIPSIWAVTNGMNLAPVALMEGTCFAKTVFGGQPSKPDCGNKPCSGFSIPPLSTVGLSEEQAKEQANSDILVFASSVNPMKNTVTGSVLNLIVPLMFLSKRREKTIMKLVVDAEMDKVLGAPMCGPDASEIMQDTNTAVLCCCMVVTYLPPWLSNLQTVKACVCVAKFPYQLSV
ncbi:hypothetical protein SLEP1_g43571 [Rubroshorea leprosula]|uniref:Uncharacterized protein n=1 Tax=Rubroshorea leprosula TaxID=152421 RepID=A0AAV5LDC8_9ROSI|nr:hypothetical protein SLEP1_g43571 [Rubroshorea leprosula]